MPTTPQGPKGYTTLDAVAAYLGRTLTAGQQVQAAALLSVAEQFIDHTTRRGWLLGPILGEKHDLIARFDVYLTNAPVQSVDNIVVRTARVGDTPQTLQAGVDYEMVDASVGQIAFARGYGDAGYGDGIDGGYGWGYGDGYTAGVRRGPVITRTYALIDYTPVSFVPADIAHAATLLVAHWTLYSIDPDRYGLSQYKLGQQIAVVVDDATKQRVIPADVLAILRAGNTRAIIG